MLDIKFIRDNADALKIAIRQKKIKLDLDELLSLDQQRGTLQKQLEILQKERNANAEFLKKSGGKPSEDVIAEGKRLKTEIAKIEVELRNIEAAFRECMVLVPVIPAPDTPIGKDESENKEVYRWGDIPVFDFPVKDHAQLSEDLDILDMERGVKVAGYRGYYVKNEGVQLMLGFLMYALQKLMSKGFTPIIPPTLVKEFALFGSGYFKGTEFDQKTDEIYMVSSLDSEADGKTNKDKKFLVGTAEPSLLAYYANEVIKEEDLPVKFVGFSQCYRSEIGSYGKDTKGIYRVHEFMKIEQVILCKADIEASDRYQQEMIDITKEIYEDFKIPYRILRICTGDMSAGKYKMFDIEAWMPGKNGWGEVASASNFLDWQARRLNVKYVDKNGEKKFVYMLNNTVIPTPRPFIALLENYQNADGSVTIPEVLRPYMGGKKTIEKKK